jgi:hypothetical protein
MRKRSLIVLSIICLLLIPIFVQASDVVINAKIDSVTAAVDKNGNDYIRFIVNETRTIQGVNYEVGVAVMAFGGVVKAARSLKDGDILKAICSQREYKGKKSYTILKLL